MRVANEADNTHVIGLVVLCRRCLLVCLFSSPLCFVCCCCCCSLWPSFFCVVCWIVFAPRILLENWAMCYPSASSLATGLVFRSSPSSMRLAQAILNESQRFALNSEFGCKWSRRAAHDVVMSFLDAGETASGTHWWSLR